MGRNAVMEKTEFQTSWGTISLTLDDSGKVVALNLPHLKTAPRTPFKATVSNGWKNASGFFQWLEKRFPTFGTSGGTALQQAVWNEIRKIPRGQTRTYGEIAAAIGRPKAVRAVGAACGANPLPLFVPCHRVVAKNGPGGFGSGLPWKRFLLQQES
jgi:O-6-methylguanine DNA methyltransferase